MKKNINFQQIDRDKLDLNANFLEILFNKGSMTAILENYFNNIDIKILKQERVVTKNNDYYIYREIIIHNDKYDLMHAISYIESDFFKILNITPDNFLEKEFLGKLIFDKKINKLNYGLTRSDFECGLIDNRLTRCSNFYSNNKPIIKLYESFLSEFFIHNSNVA